MVRSTTNITKGQQKKWFVFNQLLGIIITQFITPFPIHTSHKVMRLGRLGALSYTLVTDPLRCLYLLEGLCNLAAITVGGLLLSTLRGQFPNLDVVAYQSFITMCVNTIMLLLLISLKRDANKSSMENSSAGL